MIVTSLAFVLATAATPSLEFRVEGAGYLRLSRDGDTVYARSVKLGITKGQLTGPHGAIFLPEIPAPADLTTLRVDEKGNLYAKRQGAEYSLGRLVLATFNGGLTPDRDYLIAEDRPTLSWPGENAGIVKLTFSGKPAITTAKTPKVITAKQNTIPIAKSSESLFKGKASVTLRLDSEVEGGKITLGDIADIVAVASLKARLAAVIVGDSPAIGVTRGIDAGWIAGRIRADGLDLTQIDMKQLGSCKVHRKAQMVTQATLVAEAIKAARAKVGETIELSNEETLSDMACPIGAVTFSPENLTVGQSGAIVNIAVLVDGKRWNARVIRLKVKAGVQVNAGSVVKIRMKAGGAEVIVGGRARTSGWAGQTITVVADSGALLTGKIAADGTIEVNL